MTKLQTVLILLLTLSLSASIEASDRNEQPDSYKTYVNDYGMRHSLSAGLALTNLGTYAEYDFFFDRLRRTVTLGFYEYLFAGGARADTIYLGHRYFVNPHAQGMFLGAGAYQTHYANDADYLFGFSDDDDNPENFYAWGGYFEQGYRMRYKHALATLQYKVGLNLGYSINREVATFPIFIQVGATLGLGI